GREGASQALLGRGMRIILRIILLSDRHILKGFGHYSDEHLPSDGRRTPSLPSPGVPGEGTSSGVLKYYAP
ncbi:MAG TPA: hypothetical protein VIM11_17130, partial [Tepidisphaeraceae bacterium]